MRYPRLRQRLMAVSGGLAVLELLALPEIARADMLEGGLLATLFRGDAFSGPRLIDLVVIGVLMFLVLRLVVRRPKEPTLRRDSPSPPDEAGRSTRELPPDTPQQPTPRPVEKPTMYTQAQMTWDALKSPSPRSKASDAAQSSPAGGPPAGATSDEEFLAGAKMAYSRITASLAGGDFDDLAYFVAPSLLERMRTQAQPPASSRPDILLVEASLVGRREEPGRTVMDVDFNVLVREPGAPHNTDRRERWRFVRETATPGANWRLESTEQR